MKLETVEETDESTTTTSNEEVNQLILQIQQELTVEDKRHFDIVVMTGVSKNVRQPTSPLRMCLKVAFLLI